MYIYLYVHIYALNHIYYILYAVNRSKYRNVDTENVFPLSSIVLQYILHTSCGEQKNMKPKLPSNRNWKAFSGRSPLPPLCSQPPSRPHVAALGPAHLNMTHAQLVLQHICILLRMYDILILILKQICVYVSILKYVQYIYIYMYIVYFQRIKISECGR